jgi:hypothetical protein
VNDPVSKGHIGVSWWETKPGHWRIGACALGHPSHTTEVEGDETKAKAKALDLLQMAVTDELCETVSFKRG